MDRKMFSEHQKCEQVCRVGECDVFLSQTLEISSGDVSRVVFASACPWFGQRGPEVDLCREILS